MKQLLFLQLLLGITTLSAAAETLTEKAVLESALKHHPMVIESLRMLDSENEALRASRGAFDAKIKGDFDKYTQGFYDGEHAKAAAVKPFPMLNGEIYGGMRRSFGVFPDYEGKCDTLSNGEGFVGISLSLLRDSLIDLDRFNVRVAEQRTLQAESKLFMQQLFVQNLTQRAYWNWAIQKQELAVYQDLLAIAKDRVQGLEKRIKVGDLAKIYATENQKYIFQREVLLEKGRQDFAVASFSLSLFFRDDEGRTKAIEPWNIPNVFDYKDSFLTETLNSESDRQGLLKQAMDRSPEIQILQSKITEKDAKRQLGQNDILPKLDFTGEWSQGDGDGSSTLRGQETRVMVNLEIPIEYNKGLGKMRAARNEIEALKAKLQFTQERMRVKLDSMTQKILTTERLIELTGEQIKLSERLAEAERQKFKRGASDLILVNLREQDLAEVRFKNLEMILKWHFLIADLNLFTASLQMNR
ncbi:MAG: TolC family protein [Bdellovibrionales bacterium]|nr:TolC family protein [Bdellovibrionales bacterium]